MKRLAVFFSTAMLVCTLFIGLTLGISSFNPCPFQVNSDLKETEKPPLIDRSLEDREKPLLVNSGLGDMEKPAAKTVFIDPRQRWEIQQLIDRLGKTWDREFFRICKTAMSRAGLATSKAQPEQDDWYEDYALAMQAAQRQEKMLFIYFCDPQGDCDCNRFKTETLDDPLVRAKLEDYVCVQVPLQASIVVDGREVILLEHESFKEMLGKPGIAIVDFRHRDPQLYGTVVSTFPLEEKLWYTPEKIAVILELPPGTLTQRTLIYAVRTHPDKPASTQGEANSYLFEEAQQQSQYQADIRLQGHHRWETRFQRINARLKGLSAREVCAESWPGEHLVEAAVECVRCWRLSSGHWSAVRAYEPVYGYDMKRGKNGVWYATGIFASR